MVETRLDPHGQYKIDVAHMGAVLHYAVPSILYEKGMLNTFYTDFFFTDNSIDKAIRALISKLPGKVNKQIAGRTIVNFPAKHVRRSNLIGISFSGGLRLPLTPSQRNDFHTYFSSRFAKWVARNQTFNIDAVYGRNNSSLEFFKKAKAHGVKCILHQSIAPYPILMALMEEEFRLWRDWEGKPAVLRINRVNEREQEEWEIADGIHVGSEFVAEGLQKCGVTKDRLLVVPYAINIEQYKPSKQIIDNDKIKILYLGSVSIRKGIQYLYQAFQYLDPTKYSVKVAGGIYLNPAVVHNLTEKFDLLGIIPMQDVPALLNWADVLVLPSICEGSALATYEGLASGVPVITTPNAGSVVRNDIDGFIVPIRDSAAISEKLDVLYHDRDLLAYMSRNARKYAEENLSYPVFSERFIQAILHVVEKV